MVWPTSLNKFSRRPIADGEHPHKLNVSLSHSYKSWFLRLRDLDISLGWGSLVAFHERAQVLRWLLRAWPMRREEHLWIFCIVWKDESSIDLNFARPMRNNLSSILVCDGSLEKYIAQPHEQTGGSWSSRKRNLSFSVSGFAKLPCYNYWHTCIYIREVTNKYTIWALHYSATV